MSEVRIDVIIPAFNEADAIGMVVKSISRSIVRTIFVADNGSTDGTGDLAREAGAEVVFEHRRGYGNACMAAMAKLSAETEIVVFLDGDGADDVSFLPALVTPIIENQADLVVGSRVLGEIEKDAITPQQMIGNKIASWWLRKRFGLQATDLGPFRAIRHESLTLLGMSDPNYGWTVEMQIKAARIGLRYMEIAVPYRRRIGKSKVSGTLRGTLGAAYKILGLLALYDFWHRERKI